jgi:hypothetical protein
MDKKTKILFSILALAVVYAVAATYYRTYISRDYIISTEVECDPTVDQCFIYTCSLDEDSENYDAECSEDEAERDSYYNVVKKKLANISPEVESCDPHFSECPELSCEPGEANCETVFCDPANLKMDEKCSIPEEYNLAHPEDEEEVSECAEDDEDCLAEEDECDPESEETCVQEESECDPEEDENCSPTEEENEKTASDELAE